MDINIDIVALMGLRSIVLKDERCELHLLGLALGDFISRNSGSRIQPGPNAHIADLRIIAAHRQLLAFCSRRNERQ